MKWAILGLAVVLNAGANIFIKAAMRQTGPMEMAIQSLLQIILNPMLLLGLLSFGLALGAYSYSLIRFPLSVAYPVMTSLGLVIVAAASVVIFNESFSVVKTIGSLLILAGVAVIAQTM